MEGYKLVRLRKDGTIGPLFFDATLRIPFGKWMWFKPLQKKRFCFRPGWHVLRERRAPHLSKRGRIWIKVEMKHYRRMEGSFVPKREIWFIAKRIKVVKIFGDFARTNF